MKSEEKHLTERKISKNKRRKKTLHMNECTIQKKGRNDTQIKGKKKNRQPTGIGKIHKRKGGE